MSFFQSLSFYGESIVKLWIVFLISSAMVYFYNNVICIKVKLPFVIKFILRIIVIAPISIMVGIRGQTVGADTFNMWNVYVSQSGMSLEQALAEDASAVLFQLFRWLVSRMTDANVQIYFSLIAFITMYFVILTIEKWKIKESAFAILVFLSCYGPLLFNQARQMIAVSIMLYAYWYAYNKKIKPYVFLSVIAGLIHMSAIPAAVLTYAVQFNRKSNVRQLVYFILIAVSAFALEPIMSVVGRLFVGTKYYEKYFVGYEAVSLGLGLVLTMIPTVIPALFYRRRIDRERKISNTIMLVFPSRLAGYTSYFLYRMSYYFGCVNAIAFAKAVENSTGYKKFFARIIILGMCVVYFLLYYGWSDAYTYFPYYTFYQ